MNPLKIITIKCRSERRTVKFIYDIYEEYDVVLLQEAWLLPADINFRNLRKFSSFASPAVDTFTGILAGPTYCGAE